MGKFIWDFDAPSGSQLKTYDSYWEEQRKKQASITIPSIGTKAFDADNAGEYNPTLRGIGSSNTIGASAPAGYSDGVEAISAAVDVAKGGNPRAGLRILRRYLSDFISGVR